MAFVYEDIYKTIFISLCAAGKIAFIPSKVGSFWLNNINVDTEIDVMAIDTKDKQLLLVNVNTARKKWMLRFTLIWQKGGE